MRFVKWASVVDVRIVERDGRQWWGCSHLDDGPPAAGIAARVWLDVDDLHLLDVPFTQRRYLHRLDSLSVQDGRVSASGSTVDYDGSLAHVSTIELRCLIGGDRPAVSVPAVWTGDDGIRRTWRAEGPAGDELLRPLREKDRGTVGLALVRGEHVNVTSARSPQSALSAASLRLPGAHAVDRTRHPRPAAARQRCRGVAGRARGTPAGAARIAAGAAGSACPARPGWRRSWRSLAVTCSSRR